MDREFRTIKFLYQLNKLLVLIRILNLFYNTAHLRNDMKDSMIKQPTTSAAHGPSL